MGFQCGVQLLGQCRAAWQDSPSWITRSSLAGTFFGQTGEWNRIRAPWAPSWQFPPPHPPRFGQRPKLILSFFCLLPSNDAPMLSKQSFELYDKTRGPCFPPVSAPAFPQCQPLPQTCTPSILGSSTLLQFPDSACPLRHPSLALSSAPLPQGAFTVTPEPQSSAHSCPPSCEWVGRATEEWESQ